MKGGKKYTQEKSFMVKIASFLDWLRKHDAFLRKWLVGQDTFLLKGSKDLDDLISQQTRIAKKLL